MENLSDNKTVIRNTAEESYKAAKLLRSGNRELDRQLNTKKTKKS